MENFDSIFGKQDQSKILNNFDKQAWAEKKQAERSAVYALIDETATDMTESGESFQMGLDVMARFDRYSVGNILLITAQCPDATKLADFDTWKQSRAYVSKGEDHIKILEPGEEFRREDGSVGVNYNVKQVFDISQTNAKVRPARPNYDMRLLLKAMLHNAPCAVEISNNVPEGYGAFYDPKDRKIRVLQGMEGSRIFRSLAQELGHAHMDKGNYNRKANTFTAYCSAYVLCQRYGVDTTGFQFDMVKDTMKDMDPQDVRGELSKIRDCANQISLDMSKVLDNRKQERSDTAR